MTSHTPAPPNPEDYERLSKAIATFLQFASTGRSRAMTQTELTRWLAENGFSYLFDAASGSYNTRLVRQVIEQMRKDGDPICSAGGRGYFWPESFEDVKTCAAAEFFHRSTTIRENGDALMAAGQRHFAEEIKAKSPQQELL